MTCQAGNVRFKCAFGSGININEPCISAIVKGNIIGLDAHGGIKGNANYGLWLNNTSNVSVGGAGAGEGNVISGNNRQGLHISNSQNNTVYGNRIGVDLSDNAKGNKGNGISIYDKSSGNLIGGILAGQANTIAYNDSNGVKIADALSINNAIHHNSISCNKLRGIELDGKGNTNYPAPTIDNSSTPLLVTGKASPNAIIELFTLGSAPCDNCIPGTKKIQGKTYIGTVTALANGDWSYPALPALTETVVATASVSLSGAGNTSEFSSCSTPAACIDPILVTTPANDQKCEDGTAQFTMSATGNPGGYQWMVDKNTGTFVNVVDDANFSGAATGTLNVVAPKSFNGFKFKGIAIGATPACTTATATVTLTVDAKPVPGTIAAVNPVCQNQSATIILTGYTGAITWQQSSNGTTNFITAPGSTNNGTFTTPVLTDSMYYRATVSNGSICAAELSNIIKVGVVKAPVAGTVGNASPICKGTRDTLKLNQPYFGSIQWQDSSASNSWTTIPGEITAQYISQPVFNNTYYRAVLSNGVCPSVATSPVATTFKTIPAFSAGTDTILCEGTKITLFASAGFSDYKWQTGAATQSTDVTTSGKYGVTAIAPNGCGVTDTVNVANCFPLFIPNVFTPGSDGYNDYFVIKGNAAHAQLEVFNRWGVLVYETKNYNNLWDGRNMSGSDFLADGVYYYLYQPNGMSVMKGWVSIIKE